MTLARSHRLTPLAMAVLALACGGDDGGTGPCTPGPASQVVRSGPEHQDWYFNNPLPSPYSVTVRDANNCAVGGVSVDWAITTGGGTFSPDPSTTNANGVATTVHTLTDATTYVVTATVSGLSSVTFSASASAPPTTADVTVGPGSAQTFSPSDVVIKTGGTVTWTWVNVTLPEGHNVTYTAGPTPRPANSITQQSGTHNNTITTVGKYEYTCTLHSGMDGTVTVVN